MPLTETVAMGGVRAAGLDYGRMRLWGSLSFIAASFCGGWAVEPLGPPAAIWLMVGGARSPRSPRTGCRGPSGTAGRRRRQARRASASPRRPP